ncbi:MAG: transglycosylase domain-containing protein [Patescibacteria group bacterium]
MKKSNGGSVGSAKNRPRQSKSTYITKSGQTIKLHRNLSEKLKAKREDRARKRALRLAGMPKSRIKRIFYRMHPKRLYKYWFSREGAVMALKIAGIGTLAGFLLLVGVFAYFRKDLPNLRDISGNNIGGSISYYDKSGKTLLYEDVDGVKRIPVKDEDISPHIKAATIAIEDKDFFKHGGFDTRGILRAGINNVFGTSGGTQGGSTITQQLVKLTNNWTRDRSYTRKVKELILSVELERSYSKKEILTGYLNTAPYGGIEYGVEAASRNYFQKSAKDLTLDEAVMLASIPKSPAFYSWYSEDFDKAALVGRMQYILKLMVEQAIITQAQADEATKVDTLAKVKPRPTNFAGIKAPFFVLLAKKQLQDKYGAETVKRGGWRVTTTLDMNLQNLAEEQVRAGFGNVTRAGFDNVAFTAEDVETGQIVALVGGVDFFNKEFGQNNYAHWRLPPGSSFKPYDYTSLIEHNNNFGAGSVLYDNQEPLDGYPCTNKNRPKQGGNCLWDYDFRYPGPVTLRYGLGGSRNVPAVKAMLIAGVDKTIETTNKLGLRGGYKCYQKDVEDVQFATKEQEDQCYGSSAIGDGAYLYQDEHVHAFASLSRNGVNIPMTYILKIEDAGGKTVDEFKPSKGEQAVRPDTAYIVSDILSDPNASYFSRKSHRYKDWKFSLKTGTTNDSKDGWLMGYSTKYAAGVWVGHHTRRVATRSFMETMTQPIWDGWMKKAHENIPAKERQRPSGVQTLPAYIVRQHVGIGSVEPSPASDLYPSWYKQPKKGTGGKKVIDQVSGKLATECTPDLAKKEIDEADASTFASGDRFATQSSNTSEKDDVHKCDDVKPTITLSISSSGGGYTLTAVVVQGTHALSSEKFKGTVNFKIDSQIVPGGSFSIDASGSVSMQYIPDFIGDKTIEAEVIDGALYSSSHMGTITGGATIGFAITSAEINGSNKPVFVWTGGTGSSVKIKKKIGDIEICGGTPSDDCTGSVGEAIAGEEVYAIDSNGNKTANVTIEP